MLTAGLDLSQFQRRVSESKLAINRDVERCVQKAAEAGRDKAKQGLFKDRTGELRRGITAQIVGWSGKTYLWSFKTSEPYARFVEETTAPHWIYPKAGYNAKTSSLTPGQTRRGRGKGPHEYVVGRGRALRWKDSGGEHFASRVYHPGTMGFFFMRDAERHAENVLIQSLHKGFISLEAVWRP
jgi:hypothetical protein